MRIRHRFMCPRCGEIDVVDYDPDLCVLMPRFCQTVNEVNDEPCRILMNKIWPVPKTIIGGHND